MKRAPHVSADAIPSSTASGAAPGRPRSEIRLTRYSGPTPPAPVDLHRAHAVRGGELHWHDGADVEAALSLPEGVAGDVELCLGCADARAAHALVAAADVPPDVARAARARACLMSGDIVGAKAELGDDRDAESFAIADAALSLAEGDVRRAARRVADALFVRPAGLAEQYLLALVKVAEGDMAQATLLLSEVARSAPTHAVARYQLGQILLATGDPARAGTLFEMAWQLQPGFIAPALALAEMLADSRQYGEALGLVSRLSEVAPEALAPRLLQLRILLEVGEKESALALSAPMFAQANHDPEVALLHAEALAENDHVPQAHAVLAELLARPSIDARAKQRARRQLARLALAEHPPRSADAAQLLKEAARVGGPGAGELAIELFHVAIAVGRRVDAEEALDLVLEDSDVSTLISAAILARSHAMWAHARKLGERAKFHVAGTSAEGQLSGFLATLPQEPALVSDSSE